MGPVATRSRPPATWSRPPPAASSEALHWNSSSQGARPPAQTLGDPRRKMSAVFRCSVLGRFAVQQTNDPEHTQAVQRGPVRSPRCLHSQLSEASSGLFPQGRPGAPARLPSASSCPPPDAGLPPTNTGRPGQPRVVFQHTGAHTPSHRHVHTHTHEHTAAGRDHLLEATFPVTI